MPSKICKRCKQPKDTQAFGIDVCRPDALNLYCKDCIRQRSRDLRSGAVQPARRHYRVQFRPDGPKKRGRKRHDVDPLPAVFRGITTPVIERLVLGAIDERQHCTQHQLHVYVLDHLPERCAAYRDLVAELLGQALGELFAQCRIKTSGQDETRIYFRRKAAA